MGLFPMRMSDWAWDWAWSGWGWLAGIGFIILLGIFLLPWFFFLLNLQNLLNRVSPVNRAMPAGHVWLNFIPVFNLGWFIYTVVKVRDSVRAEYGSRGWLGEGDFGYNLGLATGVLAIVTFFLGWVPVLGWALGIAQLICWILYWLRTNDLKNRLEAGTYPRPAVYPPHGAPSGGRPSPAYPPVAPVPPGPPAPYAGTAVTATAAAAGAAAVVGEQAGAAPSAGTGSEQELICAACGATYAQEDRFCRACGLPLPQGKEPSEGPPEDAG